MYIILHIKDRGPTANQSGEAIIIITQTCKAIKKVYEKYKDIRQSMLCFSRLDASSDPRTKGDPTNNQRDDDHGFSSSEELVPSYSPLRIVRQSAMLSKRPVQGCRRAKHKTYRPHDDHWIVLSTSKALDYFKARRDETRFVFDPP